MSASRGRQAVTVAAWAIFLIGASGVYVASQDWYDTSQRGFEYMPDMAHSVPYDAYAPNPVTRDGKTLQAPVPGTVPRGMRRLIPRSTAIMA